LSTVLDTALVGIIVVDAAGQILTFNKTAERLFGYHATELLGRDVRMLLPPDYARQNENYVVHYLRSGVRRDLGKSRELKGLHRDGSTFPAELSVGEAVTAEGRQFVGIVRDLRPRHETEQRLNELQADLLRMARISAMDEMGAALAHELNQPLTALMLYLQAIERATSKAAAGLPPVIGDIVQKAVGEAERAGSIIQQMRRFVEKREPLRRLVDLGSLAQDAIELTLLGHRPRTRVRRALARHLPRVLVDPIQIQQVVVNLLRNALEAAKDVERPEVRVGTGAAAGTVTFTVEDNGPGISADALPNLFKAFASLQDSGIGLGLAISKTIAQTHGGDLMVDPGGNGRGARFTLWLPVPAPPTD
jgi:two-component system sensor kinase FixL